MLIIKKVVKPMEWKLKNNDNNNYGEEGNYDHSEDNNNQEDDYDHSEKNDNHGENDDNHDEEDTIVIQNARIFGK
jgi:hypothetical protein